MFFGPSTDEQIRMLREIRKEPMTYYVYGPSEEERLGQIQNFEHLLETLQSGDVETACIWLRAAIKRLSA